MHISIFALLDEIWIGLEIIFLRMLKDKICTRMQDVLCKHLVRKVSKTFDGIRRICENDVEIEPIDEALAIGWTFADESNFKLTPDGIHYTKIYNTED